MKKIVEIVIEIFFWVVIFISPFLFFLILALIFYMNECSIFFSAILVLIGVSIGIYFAEYIRKKHGCLNFMTNLIATKELDKDE